MKTLNQLKKEFELRQTLYSEKGFFIEYLNQLTTSTSNKVAFQKINSLFKSVFGFNKYKNYTEFNKRMKLYLK